MLMVEQSFISKMVNSKSMTINLLSINKLPKPNLKNKPRLPQQSLIHNLVLIHLLPTAATSKRRKENP